MIYRKESELRKELAKNEPDSAAASKLQTEISSLQTDLDQKHLDHLIALKKSHPELRKGLIGHNGYKGRCWYQR